MPKPDVLSFFADAFVRPPFRERFIHDVQKHPERLFEKICHSIDEVFDPRLRNGEHRISGAEPCIVIAGDGVQHLPWNEAAKLVGLRTGVLILTAIGRAFVAESEQGKGRSSVTYAGAV